MGHRCVGAPSAGVPLWFLEHQGPAVGPRHRDVARGRSPCCESWSPGVLLWVQPWVLELWCVTLGPTVTPAMGPRHPPWVWLWVLEPRGVTVGPRHWDVAVGPAVGPRHQDVAVGPTMGPRCLLWILDPWVVAVGLGPSGCHCGPCRGSGHGSRTPSMLLWVLPAHRVAVGLAMGPRP